VTAALFAGLASAASAMTMTIGDPSMTAKVLVSVPVTVSCSPFDPALTPFSASAFVSIEQAVGKSIARGTGATPMTSPGMPLAFTCDSTDQTINIDVLADPAHPPFKRGAAVVAASAFASAGQQCGPGCFFNFTTQTASVGPTVVRIR
jgi:hypothetical protein